MFNIFILDENTAIENECCFKWAAPLKTQFKK